MSATDKGREVKIVDPKFAKGSVVKIVDPEAGFFRDKNARVVLVPRFKSPRGKSAGWWYTVDLVDPGKGMKRSRCEIHECGLASAQVEKDDNSFVYAIRYAVAYVEPFRMRGIGRPNILSTPDRKGLEQAFTLLSELARRWEQEHPEDTAT